MNDFSTLIFDFGLFQIFEASPSFSDLAFLINLSFLGLFHKNRIDNWMLSKSLSYAQIGRFNPWVFSV